MKKQRINNSNIEIITFYLFVLLLISVPMVFWNGFYNGFDLVKFSAVKIIGGVFILSASVWFVIDSKSKKLNLKLERKLDPFVLFLLFSAVLSVIFSLNSYVSYSGNYESQIGLLAYIYLFLIYIILPYVINSERKFRFIFIVIETVAFITALFSIVQYFGIDPLNLKPVGFRRPVTTIGYPVFSAGFMILVFPFSVLNISKKTSSWLRIIVPAVLFAGIIATQTRTTYAALAVEVVLISLLYPFLAGQNKTSVKKYLLYSSLLLVLLILAVISTMIFLPDSVFVKRFLSIGTITKQPRWFLWRDSIEMFKHYPLTGTGIGMFSRGFEYFSSYELRYADIEGVFINAHNNFINTFCTMGFFGGIAYLVLLLRLLYLSIKSSLNRKKNTVNRTFSLAVFCCFSGYIVYGLADFDDVTILFYVFILLALFKIKFLSFTDEKYVYKNFLLSRNRIIIVSIILSLFTLYNIYASFDKISAEMKFSDGLDKYNAGDFQGFLNDVNKAVELNPDESYYKFKFASLINVYSSGLSYESAELRKQLLEKAKEEVMESENGYRSKLECTALKSLIELQLGNESEGFRLKDELFKIDTTRFSYRINLAVYYLNHGNDSSAFKEVNSVLNWDFKNVNALITKTLYYLKKKNYDEAEKTCNYILTINFGNRFAKETLREIKGSK